MGEKNIKKILLVEDGKKNRIAALKYFSKRKDLQVEAAMDYDQAMKGLKKKKFDGIITDIFMPEQTGTNKRMLGIQLYKKIYNTAYQKFEGLMQQANSGKKVDGWDVEHLDRVLNCCYKLSNAIFEDEANQPLGLLIEEKAKELGIPCIPVTSLFHHNELAEPVFYYHDKVLGSYVLIQEGLMSSNGKEKNVKEDPKYWEEAYLKLEKLMKR